MMSSVQLSPESWLQKYFWMGTWQYVTIWHPRPAKYAPFCIMYNKSTYQSIAFVHFHVYRINVLHVLYFVLFSKNPIFFFFFFFAIFQKKKTLPHLYHRRTVEIDPRKKKSEISSAFNPQTLRLKRKILTGIYNWNIWQLSFIRNFSAHLLIIFQHFYPAWLHVHLYQGFP